MTPFGIRNKGPLPEHEVSHTEVDEIVLANASSIDSTLWTLSLSDCKFQSSEMAALQELSDASTDRNAFFDPLFLSASHQRLGLAKRNILTLCEKLGDSAIMKFAVPIQKERIGFPEQNVLRVWSHPMDLCLHP